MSRPPPARDRLPLVRACDHEPASREGAVGGRKPAPVPRTPRTLTPRLLGLQKTCDSERAAKPCRHVLQGRCLRKDCEFSHDFARTTCRFWLQGQCLNGEGCLFLHDVDVAPRMPHAKVSGAWSGDRSIAFPRALGRVRSSRSDASERDTREATEDPCCSRHAPRVFCRGLESLVGLWSPCLAPCHSRALARRRRTLLRLRCPHARLPKPPQSFAAPPLPPSPLVSCGRVARLMGSNRRTRRRRRLRKLPRTRPSR